MRFDLLTLYFLAIGTLVLSAAMTLWERQARPQRSGELAVLAMGYVALAIGCAGAIARSQLPGALGAALSNLVIVTGYLLILDGAAALSGRRHRTASAVTLVALAFVWAIGGPRWEEGMWSYISAFPIAMICGATAWEMLRSNEVRSLRSRRIVVALTSAHAIVYGGRAFILPLLTASLGHDFLSVMGRVTMYEGVLYSVGLPMAMLALIREEAHDQLLRASHTDYLTGVGNRRWFFEEGERLIRNDGAHRPISLLAFDLDHFKKINDRYGHAKGDETLKLFASIARQTLGADAILARIGGEEFAALLPGHGRAGARSAGQAVASHFAETVAHGSRGIGVEATVSIGLAELGSDAADLASLLSAADRALYTAKALGRNRVEAFPIALGAAA
jgi:diguanylate cyclase (GGDEF)-like protein